MSVYINPYLLSDLEIMKDQIMGGLLQGEVAGVIYIVNGAISILLLLKHGCQCGYIDVFICRGLEGCRKTD